MPIDANTYNCKDLVANRARFNEAWICDLELCDEAFDYIRINVKDDIIDAIVDDLSGVVNAVEWTVALSEYGAGAGGTEAYTTGSTDDDVIIRTTPSGMTVSPSFGFDFLFQDGGFFKHQVLYNAQTTTTRNVVVSQPGGAINDDMRVRVHREVNASSTSDTYNDTRFTYGGDANFFTTDAGDPPGTPDNVYMWRYWSGDKGSGSGRRRSYMEATPITDIVFALK